MPTKLNQLIFRRGNLQVLLREGKKQLALYRSWGPVELPQEGDIVNALDAHWEAVRRIERSRPCHIQFDFSGSSYDNAAQRFIDHDLEALAAAGYRIEILAPPNSIVAQAPAVARRDPSLLEKIKEWEQVALALGLGILTLISLVAVIGGKFH